MNERVRIKVCGLTRPQDVLEAVRLGVDFLGFVFVSQGARCLDTHTAWLPGLDTGEAKRVGVFRDLPATAVNEVVRRFRLDFVQLDGHEPRDYPRALDVPAIVVWRAALAGGAGVPLPPNVYAALLEATARDKRPGRPRAGAAADLERRRASLPPQTRVFLSGGLTAANVAQLAAATHPFAVDVTTSVECAPGIKDAAKLRAFCAACGRQV